MNMNDERSIKIYTFGRQLIFFRIGFVSCSKKVENNNEDEWKIEI